MTMKTPMNVLLLALLMLCSVTWGASPDRLLSRNATYRLVGAGYCYTGQVQPGVNTRQPKEAFVYTPLVEQTDLGDLLIDGETAGKTMVYTPWSWSRHWKLISVEMKLPGPSKVSRVDVYLPEAVAYQPESVTLFVKSGSGAWGKVASVFSETGPRDARVHTRKLTFPLDNVACQEVKIVCSDDGMSSGVSEIEIWGQGPIESQPREFRRAVVGMPQARGLIRSRPHIETVVVPTSQLPDDSALLTKGGGTTVTLLGDKLTEGTAQMLVDGDRTTVVRVDKRAHSHFSLTAELTLPKRYLVDAVNIWMPGGKGSKSGHVHDLTVAIGDGKGDSAVWQTPVDLVVNHYWPGDDAPKPYVIPISNLNAPGRRVRITATLMGTGGVTNRLAIGEIEVWGRPADAATTALVQLNKRPIQFERRPIGKLHPKWQWLTKKRVRAAWMGDSIAANFAGTDKTKAEVLKEAGFNIVLTGMGPDRKNRNVSTALEKKLPGNVAESKRVGIPLIIRWQYGSTHLEPYRKYRAPSGSLHERSCCPLDEQYLERHIGRWAVAIAAGGADGMLIDTEMYESDQTGYPGACTCDDCFETYLKEFAEGAKLLYDQLPPERRGLWLKANNASSHYRRFQNKRIAALYDDIRQRCQAINPAFIFAHAPGTRHLSIMMRGLGTSSIPCLAFSEYEYSRGVGKRSYSQVQRIREEGIPALYLVGQFLVSQTPEMVRDNGLLGSLYCDGWWLYYAEAVLTHPDADDPQAFVNSYGRVKGTSARDYLDIITSMHQRLEKELAKPREHWPSSTVMPVPPSSD
jgi:hypothetical protein